MKKTALFISFLFFLSGWIARLAFGQAEVVFEYKLPRGWHYKSFSISDSDLKALYLLPDLPDLVLLKGEFQPRLQVFGKDGKLICDRMLEKWWWLGGFTRDDNIILEHGDEGGMWSIEIIDPKGKKVASADVGGRWPRQALLGNDIAFVPRRGEAGAVSLVDEATGREKARFEQPTRDGRLVDWSCFLPIGQDGMYVVGIGGALCLRSYLRPGVDIWTVPDIGGDIRGGWFLNDEFIEARYERDDFDSGRLMTGTAIVEWRTGRILFKKEGFQINQVQDEWHARLVAYALLVDGDLVFRSGNGDVRLPRAADPAKGWDERRMRKCHLSPGQADIVKSNGKHERPQEQRNYIIKDFGDVIRVEKCLYIDDEDPLKP